MQCKNKALNQLINTDVVNSVGTLIGLDTKEFGKIIMITIIIISSDKGSFTNRSSKI